ncbi:helix-turn-helix domain-containing protein [Antrihabitans sp. YC2-6]|uniref:helix-turn-helix domain-containing protein n=1 Tax=Antrihabitans sp. YC2-6 TaxID=2799498 RepID=UPI0018F60DAA|nr:helix-turn-helix domain-containing protein [Antrihabitans sp. YC2-6]MBJ8348241.1 helix-turn-helix domain-containing protein [Antrihabitans sp. YC2-6]
MSTSGIAAYGRGLSHGFQLPKRLVMDTTDVDDARQLATPLLSPHRLTTLGEHRFRAQLAVAPVSDCTLLYLDYGDGFRVKVRGGIDYYLLCIPIEGSVSAIGIGSAAFHSGTALLVSPTGEDLEMVHGAGAQHLMFKIPEHILLESYLRLAGRPPEKRIVFSSVLRQGYSGDSAIGNLRIAVNLTASQESSPRSLHDELQRVVVASLLLSQPNSGLDGMLATPALSPTSSTVVRQALELMRAEYSDPLTMEYVARSVSVSLRKLQYSFRQQAGKTPSAALQEIRLVAARNLICTGETPLSITDVAYAVGISHPGRFAASYRRRYGMWPSQAMGLRTGASK